MSVENNERQTRFTDSVEKNIKAVGGEQEQMYQEINSIRRESGSFSGGDRQAAPMGTELELSSIDIFSKYSTLASELGLRRANRGSTTDGAARPEAEMQNSNDSTSAAKTFKAPGKDSQIAEDKEALEERQRMVAGAASAEPRKEIERKEEKDGAVAAPPPKAETDRVMPIPAKATALPIESNARETRAQQAPAQIIPGRIEGWTEAKTNTVGSEAKANAESQKASEAQKAKEEALKKEAEKQKEIDKLGTMKELGARHPGRRSRKRRVRRRRVRGRRRVARGGGRRQRRRRIRGRRGSGRRRRGRGGRRSRGITPRENFVPRNDRAPNPADGQRREYAPQRRAVVPPPVQGDMAIKGPPTSTVDQIQQFLEQTNSPAAREQGFAKNLYDMCTKRGIDPSVALGFFMVESTMGRHGRGHNNKSIGNIRGRSPESHQTDGQFRKYNSWTEGARDWARLIDEAYVHKRGHQTLSQVVRVYCPGSEGSIRKYVSDVKGVVESFKRKNNGRSVA